MANAPSPVTIVLSETGSSSLRPVPTSTTSATAAMIVSSNSQRMSANVCQALKLVLAARSPDERAEHSRDVDPEPLEEEHEDEQRNSADGDHPLAAAQTTDIEAHFA